MTLQFGKAGLSTLQDKILAFLREYGAYVPAYELPDRLDRSFGAPVDEGACRAALDALIAKKRVSRSPDQPSMVKIVSKVGPVVLGDQPKNEAEIMPHLERYLQGDFRTVIEGEAGAFYLVVDTSHTGPATGTWRRPDFTVVNVIDLPLFGRRQVDVHSIELKTEAGNIIRLPGLGSPGGLGKPSRLNIGPAAVMIAMPLRAVARSDPARRLGT